MAVHFQFKSSTVKESIPIDGHFITVGNLKEKIIESKQLRRGNFDLVVTNSQTKEDYLDDGTLIPRYTTVLIRRVPAQTSMPIVTAPVPEPDEYYPDPLNLLKVDSESGDVQTVKNGLLGVHSSEMHYPEDFEWDEFGNDLYAIPETLPPQSGNPVQDAPPPSIVDEDSKIKALIATPALDWQRQSADGFGSGRGFGRGMGGRMMGGRGFGRGGLERKTPPQGYICHRCKVPGHFIQHCPTNGDPNYDIKRVKPPTGIPKSMLMATPDGSYALPSGAVAVLKPNEAAFEKEIEGLPSTRSVGDLPPELHCPLCKQVMKDAVLTSKCCFKSFCDKCIREYIITKSMCVCGAMNILADDLLPNKTLRDTINRILESNNSSGEIGGGASQIQDMESRNPQPRAPSPTHSVASKGERVPPPTQKEETLKVHEVVEEGKPVVALQQTTDKLRLPKVADASEATHESVSVKEPASQGSAPLADEEVQQKPVSAEAAKKKKKKKARIPMPGVAAAEMQWRAAQDLAAENYMMSMGPAAYNPYWTGMQPGMDAFMPPYGGTVPYMGFGLGPMDVPFGGVVLPPDPFGGQGMMPFGPPPQRDLADFGMGFNPGPPLLSREEFEARKANVKRKREIERRGESRELPKDREYGREVSSSGGDISSLKFKSKALPPPSSSDHPHRNRPDNRPSPDRRSRDPELPRPLLKKKLEHDSDHSRHRDHRDDYYVDTDHHRDHKDADRHSRDLKDERHNRDHSHRSSSHHRSELTARPAPEAAAAAAAAPPLPLIKAMSAAEKKKASVFSRISYPAEDQEPASKKRKQSSSSEAPTSASGSHKGPSNGHYEHKSSSVSTRRSAAPASVDYESSDDERHFKRRPSRYESSPPVAAAPTEWEEARHSKGSREREREREREKERGGYSSKHNR